MNRLATTRRRAADVGGRALRAATVAVARLRRADKPLHPRGEVTPGILHRHGAARPSGVAWLDRAGDDDALVRLSRSVGLPGWAPDVLGLAVRVPTDDGGHGDLLFSSTGRGPVSRFLLVPRRSPYAGPMSTLLPYRTPSGPLLLAAERRDEATFDLSWAVGRGPWNPFGVLRLSVGVPAQDASVSFDPVRNPVPGLQPYDWVRRLRAPAYAAGRRSRRAAR
jgi:hypothetical protein